MKCFAAPRFALFSKLVGRAVIVAALLVVSACSKRMVMTLPPVPPKTIPLVAMPRVFLATPDLSQKERILLVIRLLNDGDVERARAELQAYLLEAPQSQIGLSLLAQIDEDPVQLLGGQNFSYEVRANESLSRIADRFLGDRYKFWALARYNDLKNPMMLTQGRLLKIPGLPRVFSVMPPYREADEEEVAKRLEEESREKREPLPVKTPPTLAKPAITVDIAKASALRKMGLERLRRGQVDLAISLFSQAIDYALGTPSFNVIERDLQKALQLKKNLGTAP